MNRGVMLKSMREVSGPTLIIGAALMIVEALLAWVLPTVQQQMATSLARLPFTQTIIRALVGTDVGDIPGPDVFTAVPWVHPVTMALLWAHAAVVCTRLPAGEVDRGTIDVLLSLPVSRWRLYLSEGLVWFMSGVFLVVVALIGNVIGGLEAPPGTRPPPARLPIAVVNVLALYLAVGGLAWLCSALSSRRGRTIGIVVGIVLASFLLNFLAEFWLPAKRLSFLSVLSYHRPLVAFRTGDWPWRDLAVLGATGLALWVGGGLAFARRDLATA